MDEVTKIFRTEAPSVTPQGTRDGSAAGHGSKRQGQAHGAWRTGEAEGIPTVENDGASIESDGRGNPAGFRSDTLVSALVEVVELCGTPVELYSVRITEA